MATTTMVAVHVLPPLSVLFKEALQREYQPGYVKEEDVDSDAAAPTPGQVTPIEQPPDASNRACVKLGGMLQARSHLNRE